MKLPSGGFSDDSSDEESDEEEIMVISKCVTVWFKAPKSKVAAKNDPTAATKKKEVSLESSDESSEIRKMMM
ncbi:hypothetical protein D8674_005869 [Pyrus ussuriensis x Pyrus communis]|uniref:Uncharacterized protein n=1 Tax=Pyrus ussuriensis x Pyrus communis TaxID=2448454 RepID=A0A5N5FYB5_9ROSA|nr:hypothetical protein D8674_005869 [Pyrus ussuriensis x Pyrus communis]